MRNVNEAGHITEIYFDILNYDDTQVTVNGKIRDAKKIFKLSSLDKIYFAGFETLTGCLPKEVGYSNLRELAFEKCSIEGEIPEEILFINNLESISLSYNKLSGNIIPKGILDLPKLKHFCIGGTQGELIFPTFGHFYSGVKGHVKHLLRIINDQEIPDDAIYHFLVLKDSFYFKILICMKNFNNHFLDFFDHNTISCYTSYDSLFKIYSKLNTICAITFDVPGVPILDRLKKGVREIKSVFEQIESDANGFLVLNSHQKFKDLFNQILSYRDFLNLGRNLFKSLNKET